MWHPDWASVTVGPASIREPPVCTFLEDVTGVDGRARWEKVGEVMDGILRGEAILKGTFSALSLISESEMIRETAEGKVTEWAAKIAKEVVVAPNVNDTCAKWSSSREVFVEFEKRFAAFGDFWESVRREMRAKFSDHREFVGALVDEICRGGSEQWKCLEILVESDIVDVEMVERIVAAMSADSLEIKRFTRFANALPAELRNLAIRMVRDGIKELSVIDHIESLDVLCEIAGENDELFTDIENAIVSVVDRAQDEPNPFVQIFPLVCGTLGKFGTALVRMKIMQWMYDEPLVAAKLLAQYVHETFRKLQFYVDDKTLGTIALLHELISEKAVFAVYHTRNIVHRLVRGGQFCVAADRALQKLLKIPAVGTLLQDHAATNDIAAGVGQLRSLVTFAAFNVSFFRPMFPCNPKVPEEVGSALNKFRSVFMATRERAILSWDYELSSCRIRSSVCAVKCNALYGIALIEISRASRTIVELSHEASVGIDKMEEIVTTLIKLGVVTNMDGKVVLRDDALGKRVVIPIGARMAKDGRLDIPATVDPHVMRVVKRRKRISLNDIHNELRELAVNEAELDARVEHLVTRKLIFRDNDNFLQYDPPSPK